MAASTSVAGTTTEPGCSSGTHEPANPIEITTLGEHFSMSSFRSRIRPVNPGAGADQRRLLVLR